MLLQLPALARFGKRRDVAQALGMYVTLSGSGQDTITTDQLFVSKIYANHDSIEQN